MDTVFLRSLRLDAVIGVYPWERCLQQTLLVDLDMAWDIRPAAAADDLTLALDYAAVAQALNHLVKNSQYQLLETLAEAIAQCILTDFAVPWVRVVLHKPGAVLQAQTLGVDIQRGIRPAC